MHFSKNINGYSLVELMISIVIGMLLIAAASATYVAQNRSFTAQESVSEVNTQSKIAHDLVSNDIRSAGFGVALDMSIEPVNGYTNIVTPGPLDSTNAPDAVTVVGGFRQVGTLWPIGSAPGVSCAGSPTVPQGTSAVQIIYNANITDSQGPNASDRRFLSIDSIDFLEVSSCGIGADNNCAGVGASITLNKPLTQNFPLIDTNGDGLCDVGRPVYLIEDITFCVNTTDNTLRRIRRLANVANCTGIATSLDEVLADNIEDLQLAYALDTNGDGYADMVGGNMVFVNPSAVSDPSLIRAVRVNVLARTDRPDPQYRAMGIRPTPIENRNHDQTPDDFRRRWWQTIVSVRNN